MYAYVYMENRKNGGKLKERKKTMRPTIFLPFFYYHRKKKHSFYVAMQSLCFYTLF